MSGGSRGSESQYTRFRGGEKVVEGERAGLYKGTKRGYETMTGRGLRI